MGKNPHKLHLSFRSLLKIFQIYSWNTSYYWDYPIFYAQISSPSTQKGKCSNSSEDVNSHKRFYSMWMNTRVMRFSLKTALKSLKGVWPHVWLFLLVLRPSSPLPPWPRMCPSVTLCPCLLTRLSTATTRNGWCRQTFRWLLLSDRASRPSMCTRVIPLTDKVGLTEHTHTHTPAAGAFTILAPCLPPSPACSCEAEPHDAALSIRWVWLYWWLMAAPPCISCAFCSRHSDTSVPVCSHNKWWHI